MLTARVQRWIESFGAVQFGDGRFAKLSAARVNVANKILIKGSVLTEVTESFFGVSPAARTNDDNSFLLILYLTTLGLRERFHHVKVSPRPKLYRVG